LKILIARGDVLGDVVVTTPLIEGLKKRFPTCEITYFIRHDYIPLLESDPRIKGFIDDTLPYTLKIGAWGHFFKLCREIRRAKFDLFIGSWEKPRYGVLAFLSGIKLRFGHNSSFWNRVFYTHTIKIDYLDFFIHKVQYNLSLLKPLGIASNFPVTLKITTIRQVDVPYIVLHLDAGNPIRILFKEQFLAIVKGLISESTVRIVLLGREKNLKTADYIMNEIGETNRVVNSVNKLDLTEVKDLIAYSTCLIGSDSGPVHIASGFHVPVVVYYLNRIQNACHWGPWMTPHRIVMSQHTCVDKCSPEQCIKTTCREALLPQDILLAYKHLMKEKKDDIEFDEPDIYHWLKTTVTIAVFGQVTKEMLSYLTREGWSFVQVDSSLSLKNLNKLLSENNINMFLFPSKLSLFQQLRIEVLRRWLSNYIAFFPKIFIAYSPFSFELQIRRNLKNRERKRLYVFFFRKELYDFFS
jgi:ADP-heptose:LPS heptosyltransferase